MLTAYRLTRKYVNQDKDIPQAAQNILYYSLAIGHHVGVIDCLEPLVQVEEADYRAWLEGLPPSDGRERLAGALRWGEIELNCTAAGEVLPLLPGAPQPFGQRLAQALAEMQREPALYVMLRRQ
jgi:hypothetical protein